MGLLQGAGYVRRSTKNKPRQQTCSVSHITTLSCCCLQSGFLSSKFSFPLWSQYWGEEEGGAEARGSEVPSQPEL
jgi:hypothetical protein